MATRYEVENGEPDLELTEELQEQSDDDPVHAKLSVLLTWHNNDPVDDTEQTRNNIIYSYQNNRNPYIDHPEYVDLIWGKEDDDPDEGESVLYSDPESEIILYPNPTNGQIKIDSKDRIAQLKIYDMAGKFIRSIDQLDSHIIVLGYLPSGKYHLSIQFSNSTIRQLTIVVR